MRNFSAREIKIALSLKHKRDYFMTEVKNGPTHFATNLRIIDAVAISKSWANPCITGYEIKVSRPDFLNDEKWHEYLGLCHKFSFVAPKGLIDKKEIDKRCGLLTINEYGKLYTQKKPLFRKIELDIDFLWYIIITRLENDRYPFHSNQADYWKDWLNHKKLNSELGYELRAKIAGTIRDLQRKLDAQERDNADIRKVMKEHDIKNHWDLERVLKSKKVVAEPWMQSNIKGTIENLNKLLIELFGEEK